MPYPDALVHRMRTLRDNYEAATKNNNAEQALTNLVTAFEEISDPTSVIKLLKIMLFANGSETDYRYQAQDQLLILQLASAYLNINDVDRAIQSYQLITPLTSKINAVAARKLAVLYQQQGHTNKATAILQQMYRPMKSNSHLYFNPLMENLLTQIIGNSNYSYYLVGGVVEKLLSSKPIDTDIDLLECDIAEHAFEFQKKDYPPFQTENADFVDEEKTEHRLRRGQMAVNDTRFDIDIFTKSHQRNLVRLGIDAVERDFVESTVLIEIVRDKFGKILYGDIIDALGIGLESIKKSQLTAVADARAMFQSKIRCLKRGVKFIARDKKNPSIEISSAMQTYQINEEKSEAEINFSINTFRSMLKIPGAQNVLENVGLYQKFSLARENLFVKKIGVQPRKIKNLKETAENLNAVIVEFQMHYQQLKESTIILETNKKNHLELKSAQKPIKTSYPQVSTTSITVQDKPSQFQFVKSNVSSRLAFAAFEPNKRLSIVRTLDTGTNLEEIKKKQIDTTQLEQPAIASKETPIVKIRSKQRKVNNIDNASLDLVLKQNVSEYQKTQKTNEQARIESEQLTHLKTHQKKLREVAMSHERIREILHLLVNLVNEIGEKNYIVFKNEFFKSLKKFIKQENLKYLPSDKKSSQPILDLGQVLIDKLFTDEKASNTAQEAVTVIMQNVKKYHSDADQTQLLLMNYYLQIHANEPKIILAKIMPFADLVWSKQPWNPIAALLIAIKHHRQQDEVALLNFVSISKICLEFEDSYDLKKNGIAQQFTIKMLTAIQNKNTNIFKTKKLKNKDKNKDEKKDRKKECAELKAQILRNEFDEEIKRRTIGIAETDQPRIINTYIRERVEKICRNSTTFSDPNTKILIEHMGVYAREASKYLTITNRSLVQRPIQSDQSEDEKKLIQIYTDIVQFLNSLHKSLSDQQKLDLITDFFQNNNELFLYKNSEMHRLLSHLAGMAIKIALSLSQPIEIFKTQLKKSLRIISQEIIIEIPSTFAAADLEESDHHLQKAAKQNRMGLIFYRLLQDEYYAESIPDIENRISKLEKVNAYSLACNTMRIIQRFESKIKNKYQSILDKIDTNTTGREDLFKKLFEDFMYLNADIHEWLCNFNSTKGSTWHIHVEQVIEYVKPTFLAIKNTILMLHQELLSLDIIAALKKTQQTMTNMEQQNYSSPVKIGLLVSCLNDLLEHKNVYNLYLWNKILEITQVLRSLSDDNHQNVDDLIHTASNNISVAYALDSNAMTRIADTLLSQKRYSVAAEKYGVAALMAKLWDEPQYCVLAKLADCLREYEPKIVTSNQSYHRTLSLFANHKNLSDVEIYTKYSHKLS